MCADNTALVAIEKVAYHFDKPFSYLINEQNLGKVKVGARVIVGFGRSNQKRQGVVVATQNADTKGLKPIIELLDETPILNEEMVELAKWIKERTFCTLFDAFKIMLPTAMNYKVDAKYSLKSEISISDIECFKDDERRIIEFLETKKTPISQKTILKNVGISPSSKILEKLFKLGFLEKSDFVKRKIKDESVLSVRLNSENVNLNEQIEKLTSKQKSVVELLRNSVSMSVKEACYFGGVTSAVINTLEKKAIVEKFEEEVLNKSLKKDYNCEQKEIVLTDEQDAVYKDLLQKSSQNASATLLFGVTGSGKTQVFLKLIDDVLKKGKSVIVMVPEISLTAQTLFIFESRYGEQVAVIHSKLSDRERLDEFKRIKDGKAKIAIGTRSAVFAPFKDLGLIVMDEEHEGTYKSESQPRYHARDVARFRCVKNNALLLLASATPSVESYTAALTGRYSLSVLQNRYSSAKLPDVVAVDMKDEVANGNYTSISATLYNAINETLNDGKQVILLMNRRGYNTFVSCRGCGHVVVCPNCSISMTYHSMNNRLMCHYCGFSKQMEDKCSECGEKTVKYSGAGTQKIEEEIASFFPSASVLRMDADTTLSKNSHQKKFEQFSSGKYNIMLGTQMVAKGLNFEKVTLVGVINADQSLYSDDYKSMEKTFALLTQVVGRCGRGKYSGKAIIQTTSPDHPVIELAAKQDYPEFYDMEIQMRKMLTYPPYCDILLIGFVGEDDRQTNMASRAFLNIINNINIEKFKDVKIITLEPMPAKVVKVSGKYRYRIIIKCKNTKRLREMVSESLIKFSENKEYKKITAYVDVNPDSCI